MPITIRVNLSGDEQESNFMNATQQSVSNDHSLSIAVHLPEPNGVDLDDTDAVEAWLTPIFASAIAAGAEIEVQVGPEHETLDED